jgi:hypothetical protein
MSFGKRFLQVLTNSFLVSIVSLLLACVLREGSLLQGIFGFIGFYGSLATFYIFLVHMIYVIVTGMRKRN